MTATSPFGQGIKVFPLLCRNKKRRRKWVTVLMLKNSPTLHYSGCGYNIKRRLKCMRMGVKQLNLTVFGKCWRRITGLDVRLSCHRQKQTTRRPSMKICLRFDASTTRVMLVWLKKSKTCRCNEMFMHLISKSNRFARKWN